MKRKRIKPDNNYTPKGKKRKMYVYYNQMQTSMEILDNNRLGELWRDIFTFEMSEEEPESFSDDVVKALYQTIRFSVLELKANYTHRCAVNNEIAKKKKNRKDKDTGKDTDKDKNNGIVNVERDEDKAKTDFSVLSPQNHPTLEEIETYVYGNGIEDVDPELFYDKMEEVGWVNSRGQPLKSWKASVRVWEKRAVDFM